MAKSKTRCIGLLTSGGDCPGLNAVIRAIAKVALHEYGIKVVGVQDGFRGLVENRTIPLDEAAVSGILTRGGTILGASRDKPHSMPVGDKLVDMTEAAAENLPQAQDGLPGMPGRWRHRQECLPAQPESRTRTS